MKMAKQIGKDELLEAQKLWGDGIIEIGEAYLDNGEVRKATQKLLDNLYGFREGTVLFKPTKASDSQFRLTVDSALSYFIGQNSEYAEDKGFAIQPWKNVRFENDGFIFNEKQALAMGNYYFTDYKGNEVKVEYTFGYFCSEPGSLKINLHHSSLPFKKE